MWKLVTALPLLGTLVAAAVPDARAGSAPIRWPDANPGGTCFGRSLQQCIDFVPAGSTIEIVAPTSPPSNYLALSSSLFIDKALGLIVTPGVDAVFAAGHGILARPRAGAMALVHIDGFVFMRGGIRIAPEFGSLPGSLTVLRNRVRDAQPDVPAIDIEIGSIEQADQWNVEVRANHIDLLPRAGASSNGIAIAIANNAVDTVVARVLDNRIESRGAEAMRNGITVVGTHIANLRIERNSVQGRSATAFSTGSIAVSMVGASGQFTRIADNLVLGNHGTSNAGLRLIGENGEFRVVNNSIVGGFTGIQFSSLSSTTGPHLALHNNLVQSQAFAALSRSGTFTTLSTSRNLLYANANEAPGSTLSADTLRVDPQIEDPRFPRPRTAASPLVGAANALAYAAESNDPMDVTGDLRENGALDIGAIEWNDDRIYAHETSAATLQGNFSRLGLAQIDAADLPQVTPILRAGLPAAELASTLGIWAPGPDLSVYNQNPSIPLSADRRFVVGALRGGAGFVSVHDSDAGSTASFSDSSTLALVENGFFEPVASVVHRYEGPLGNQYHDHPLGLAFGLGSGWRVRNQDLAPMPAGRRFHIAQAWPGSANAFITSALGSNAPAIPLAHPLLDDAPCALPLVSRGHDRFRAFTHVANATAFALELRPPSGPGAPARWHVVAASGSFPAGSAFNVIIGGAQAQRCVADADLFRSGFE